MSDAHTVRAYEYVPFPYEAVRDALCTDPQGAVDRATSIASERARRLVPNLHVQIAGITVGAAVVIRVGEVAEELRAPCRSPRLRIALEWRAAQASAWFPVMKASLSVYALSKDETQVELVGDYTPPLGVVGEALDVVVGHRIADATALSFVASVAAKLRAEIEVTRRAHTSVAQAAQKLRASRHATTDQPFCFERPRTTPATRAAFETNSGRPPQRPGPGTHTRLVPSCPQMGGIPPSALQSLSERQVSWGVVQANWVVSLQLEATP